MENNTKQKISVPVAIIIAGLLIMIGILVTKYNSSNVTNESKTLSEQVGVNNDEFTKCLNNSDLKTLTETTDAEAQKAMQGIPTDQRGTPYSVIVGKNGVKTDIRGAYPKEVVNQLITEVESGKVTTEYTGDLTPYHEGDHIMGNPDAPIMVIEYSDLECPFCKRFDETMRQIVEESNGNVAWVYRHWIVHPGAVPKTAAAECVAKLKGEDAFWQYIHLVFGLIQTESTTPSTDNL